MACHCAQVRDLQAQLSSAIATGSPVFLRIPAGTLIVNQSLVADLRTSTRPVAVNIRGQGVNSTILDCQGQALTAILVKNASSTTLSDLTVQNCGGDTPGACSACWPASCNAEQPDTDQVMTVSLCRLGRRRCVPGDHRGHHSHTMCVQGCDVCSTAPNARPEFSLTACPKVKGNALQ